MAFINAEGTPISYECDDLIAELKEDIKEFGENEKVIVWCKNIQGVTIYANYDFIIKESPVFKQELHDGEFLVTTTMGKLLPLLEQQNELF